MLPVLIALSIIVLVVASYADLKTLEVPDWLNYSGIFAGLGVHALLSLHQSSFKPLFYSFLGLVCGFIIACILFYTGQWGGGDAKLLIAVGSIAGFTPGLDSFFLSFVVNLVLLGALWGVLFSLFLAFKNRKKFTKTFKRLVKKRFYFNILLSGFIFFVVAFFASFFFKFIFLELILFGISVFALSYFIVFVKAVEFSCMYKKMSPDKLVEGDWLVKDVKVNNIVVKRSKIGLEKQDIVKLKRLFRQKKIKTVLVRYGIPFTPAFLAAFVVALCFGNLIFLVLQNLIY
ncbi:hypothetical protein DRJ22_01990 [Candidatus Woesearchaeota archaeon]|nr:MAG: hypothetical protein DRJ22_01990 [Candidatus Woesearchaeota archaeon]